MSTHKIPSPYLISFYIICLLLSSCSLSSTRAPEISKSQPKETSTPAKSKNDLPYFQPGDCRFPVPPGKVICGDLFVLEDRSNPESSIVSLHAAVFPSFSSDPEPDPVIYLMGGGGGDALGAANFYLGAAGNRVRANRDFILYNQRGVKRNDPYLACPGEGEFQSDLNSFVHPKHEAEQMEYDFLMGCRDHLKENGINLEFYDSVTHAADLADLIQTLDYEQANIYGTSYGTRLGLTFMRHYPDLVRSAILDSILPPQINFPSDGITSFIVAVENLFSACSTQDSCRESYPDLEMEFYNTIEKLAADPPTISVAGKNVVLDHILYLDSIYMLLHPPSSLPLIPEAIHKAHTGDYSLLKDPISSVLSYSDFVATGVNYSSMCKDEVNFDSLERSQSLLVGMHEGWQDYFNLAFYYQTCQDWITESADPIENTPVVSDIPTLVLTGHFDSITAPAWNLDTANYLKNSYYFEFLNMAHGVLRYDNCALEIGLEFIDDPNQEPNSECMDEIGFPVFK